MKAYKFEDFQAGVMVINGHDVVVEKVIHSSENGNVGHQVKASVDGGKVRLYQMSNLCRECGAEYAKARTGKASGTKVLSTKTEEERIEAKARLKYKDATKGLEAMEAAGLLSGKALATAKKELEAKIKAEQERLTAEAVAEKVRKAEESEAKKAKNAANKMVVKVCDMLDHFGAPALMTFLKAYIDSREDAKAIMEVVTKAQELDDARNEELGQMYGFNA